MSVSDQVVIMTKDELKRIESDAFNRGRVYGYEELKNPRCHGGSDGDCFWSQCPQERDKEPQTTGRHCPLDVRSDDE